jgi:hypothetical protein
MSSVLPIEGLTPTIKWFGFVDGLFYAPRAMLPMRSVSQLKIIEGKGVEGDRYAMGRGYLTENLALLGLTERRHVSLFEQETVDALKRDHNIILGPGEHRRNITTVGVPLNHLVGKSFRVGEIILEGASFPPCKHLEDVIGHPVAPLLINRCGLHGRVIRGGTVNVGDVIEML